MTNLVRKTIRCPYCRDRFSFLTYASINAILNPELLEKFVHDAFFSTCPSCHQKVRLNLTPLINAPQGIFSMASHSSFEAKLKKLRDYGVIRDIFPPPMVKQKIKQFDQQATKTATVHLHSYTPKKRYTQLEEMILRFASVLRSKNYNDEAIDASDWNEFDLITLKILKKIKKSQTQQKNLEIFDRALPFKKDSEIMEGWVKIKTFMSQEPRPPRKGKSFTDQEMLEIQQLQKVHDHALKG